MEFFERYYPLLSNHVNTIKLLCDKRLNTNRNLETKEVETLVNIHNTASDIAKVLNQNKVISQLDFQELVNQLYKRDKSLEVIQLILKLKATTQATKIGRIEVELFKNEQNER